MQVPQARRGANGGLKVDLSHAGSEDHDHEASAYKGIRVARREVCPVRTARSWLFQQVAGREGMSVSLRQSYAWHSASGSSRVWGPYHYLNEAAAAAQQTRLH